MPLRLLTAGESHGPALTAILEGIPAGLPLSPEIINREMERRQKGYGAGPRMQIERDEVKILGGVMAGLTTGAPLAFSIENRDHIKWLGKRVPAFTIPRPGHADLAASLKYGYPDLRPALERASARETAARVAVGAVCKHLLSQFGVRVGGWVSAIGEVTANLDGLSFEECIARAEESPVRCPSPGDSEAMQSAIRAAMQARDTLGGILEAAALRLPPGLGSHVHWDRRLETRLGAAVLSVPAVKGVEIGPAFANARLPGTHAQDAIRLDGDTLVRRGFRSGGLEAGITTGEPLYIRAAMKPIATTLNPQESVDLKEGVEVETRYERSDFCPVPRAVPILEAVLSIVLADALLEKLGGDSLDEILPRFQTLHEARLTDIQLTGGEHVWWPEGEDNGLK
jgi:chorismate synthase